MEILTDFQKFDKGSWRRKGSQIEIYTRPFDAGIPPGITLKLGFTVSGCNDGWIKIKGEVMGWESNVVMSEDTKKKSLKKEIVLDAYPYNFFMDKRENLLKILLTEEQSDLVHSLFVRADNSAQVKMSLTASLINEAEVMIRPSQIDEAIDAWRADGSHGKFGDFLKKRLFGDRND